MNPKYHGTLTGYTNYRCRCEECTTCMREYRRNSPWFEQHREHRANYQREYRARRRELRTRGERTYGTEGLA